MIAVYRGESSLIDYIMAGALTGGVYKANLGVAATIVGATLGMDFDSVTCKFGLVFYCKM
ncbi:hypothetical protein RR46_00526 [Papilio xuthus]|uniref:Uncharacterized protein n=1 Tax=Papilio xuthus TaxID=66420 RepID=A0A0N0PA67_PAPXU|nr:hypothetical protein RR46_00526 [Papilio xuthus]